MIEKARSVGNSELAVPLSDESCAYLVAVIAQDLSLEQHFPEIPPNLPPFFGPQAPEALMLGSSSFWPLVERLISLDGDADTYFACLAMLHKCRLKYARILQRQPIPTMDQVGPRGLLQYGSISPRALTAFMLWRKWLYDIDNRAAQETGYLFEPILAHSIGGVPVSATKSPVRRHRDGSKGRQVDCIRENRAYEIKLRVTIAASGQGRWAEEIDFPVDARRSGYTPVLVVFDRTPNPKLDALTSAFVAEGGEVYVGETAWNHLDSVAGPTMAKFVDRYVREPISALLNDVPADGVLPPLVLSMTRTNLALTIEGQTMTVVREAPLQEEGDAEIPDDVGEESPGP